MQLEALKIFCDVVRCHSFSRGASANGMSQSAASQVVHQLEKRLGVQLIDRSRRPWVLTEEGTPYHQCCQELVERYAQVEAMLRRRRQSPAYTIRVAAIYSVGLQDMGQYVERFREVMPGSDVHLEYVHPKRVYECVLGDEADLGLISFPRTGRELESIAWRNELMVLTCLPSHQLARHQAVLPAELEGEHFVAFERGLAIRREVSRYLRAHGVHVEVITEFDNIETIKKAVEDAVGIAILPEPTLRRELDGGTLVAVPLVGKPLVRPLSIIHRRRRPLNAAVKRLIELLTEPPAVASKPAQLVEPDTGRRAG